MRFALILLVAGCTLKDAVVPGDTADTAVPAPWDDEDQDGYVVGSDCVDTDPSIYPGADEVCDGVDNDCDTEIDEGATQTWYADSDGDGYGDAGTGQELCEGADGLVDNSTDCDDSDAAVNPGATEEERNGVDDDCDGVGVQWEGDIKAEGVEEVEIWGLDEGSPEGDYSDTSDHAGKYVVSPGDVTGDGVDDLVIASTGADSATVGVDCGGAFLYAGPLTEDKTLESATGAWYGYFGGLAGYGLTTLGDVDGSGTPDLGVGNYAGRYWIVLTGGSADEPLTTGVEIYDGGTTYFGLASSGGSDYDGDGAVDLIVGATLENGSEYGAARLYTGDLLDAVYANPTLNIAGAEVRGRAGSSVLLMDLDGDGVSEAIVGAPQAYGAASESGAAYVIPSGLDGNISADEGAVITVDISRCGVGSALANTGDVTGDGQDDLLVGADTCGVETMSAIGLAFLVPGGTSTDGETEVFASAYFSGEKSYDYLGHGLGAVGDLDGDGAVDLAIGAYGRDESEKQGLVALWYGPIGEGSFPASGSSATFYGSESNEDLGYALAGGRDLTGDGWPDLVFGGHGADRVGVVRVVSGNAW